MLGRGVVGDVSLESVSAMSGGGGCDELTERKVAAIFVVVGWWSGAAERGSKGERKDPKGGQCGA